MKNVSRETFDKILTKSQYDKLIEYQELLIQWNKNINLVSRKLNTAQFSTHIFDAIFLSDLIKNKDARIADIGSGAGMPGIILAILGFSHCHLIEINNKKTVFLKTVAMRLKLDIEIIKADFTNVNIKTDYIVSKAFASTLEIVKNSTNLRYENTQYLLLKSLHQVDELKDLKCMYNFSWKVHKSNYNNQSIVIRLSNITNIKSGMGNA